MLFAKYANPMILLDGMIRARRFKDFCLEFIQIRNQETEEKTLWEYYLHRVYDQSFNEFKDSLKVEEQSATQETIKTTIADSRQMLNEFTLM